MKKIMILSLALILLLAGCAVVAPSAPAQADEATAAAPEEATGAPVEETQAAAPPKEPAASFIDVGAQEFEALIAQGHTLLDVRTQGEYDEGHIEGSTLIPVDELKARVAELDDSEGVLVYCRSGNRSVTASDILTGEGFDPVYNLVGGIRAWEAYKSE